MARKSLVCDVCNKTFNTVHDLTVHIRSHTGEKPFVCNYCNKQFSQRGNFNIHLKTHADVADTPVPEKTVACEVCPRTFSEESHLDVHMRTHTDCKLLVCNYCNKQFDVRSKWKYHMGLHVKATTPAAETRCREKPFVCEVCHKTFAKRTHLDVHKRTHTGEKPYACDDCGKRFSQSGHLKTHHLRFHAHGKIFGNTAAVSEGTTACWICQKVLRSNYLKDHLRMHTGEKPYACNLCNKQFGQRCNLRWHMRTMHTDKKTVEKETSSVVKSPKLPMRKEVAYSCEICHKHFNGRKLLNNHLCIVVRSVKEVENVVTG